MGPLGWQETVFIFVLALLVFGPRKLPELGKTIGKAITEFRRASSDLKATFDREMRSMEQETQSLREITNSYQNELQSSTYDSPSSYDSSSYGYGDSHSDPYSYGSDSSGTSTVGASATEGAESTASTASDTSRETAEGGGTGATTAESSRSAEPTDPDAPEASGSRAVPT